MRTRQIGPLLSFRDFWRRLTIWLSLLREYPEVRLVYKKHRADGFFAYGDAPKDFSKLNEHDAMVRLLSMRRKMPASRETPARVHFHSTLRFHADGAVLPTYLPVEEGAAAALGALSLAAADLYELRTGRAQQVVVRQTAAGLLTASYLFFYAQPSGKWGGCHGFDQTMAAEGSIKPHRKAYQCAGSRQTF